MVDNKILYIVILEDGRKLLTTDVKKVKNSRSFYEVDCFKNNVLEINEDIDEIDSQLFCFNCNINGNPCKKIQKIIINSNRPVTIGEKAFYLCNELETLEINCPKEVVIEKKAFALCNVLNNVTINCNDGIFDSININLQSFYGCLGLENINISKSDNTTFDKESFSLCRSLKKVNQNTNTLVVGDFAFYECNSLEEFNFPNHRMSAFEGVFNSCESLKRIEFNNINCLSGGTHSQYSNLFKDTEIVIKKANVSDLIKYRKYNHFVIENLIIDDLSEKGINNLNNVLSMYSRDVLKKITIGQFELKNIVSPIYNSYDLIHLLDADDKIIKLFELLITYYNREPKLLCNIINNCNREAIEKNLGFIESLNVNIIDIANSAFLSLPKLFEIDINVVFNNIRLIRKSLSVSDDDIRIYYFDDTNLTIDLDDPNSIRNYLSKYISSNEKFPLALNSLFCNSDDETISERIDRLNYVISMHIVGEEKDELLSEGSIDTIKSIDDESYNSIFGDYKERASHVNSSIPYLQGVKTLVYEKLKGYIYQDNNENILFDEVFGNLLKNVNNNYAMVGILDYFSNINRYFNDSSSKELEYKKNVICGRILYTLISKLKMCSENDISEEYIRNQLFNFKSIREDSYVTSSRFLFSHNFDSVDDPECIEIMLKIDPYSFDLFRNYSGKDDIPLKVQLMNYISSNRDLSKRKRSNNRFLYEKSSIDKYLFIGYEDVRYYRIAKASGYRFTKEEDNYYEEKIKDFNKQLDELITDPMFERFKDQLIGYRIGDVNTKPDIMKVFYEFLQNQEVPSNISSKRSHDFENRVKSSVKRFIDVESKNGTRLSKILASIEMLYRSYNPSIIYKDTGKIIENPLLIRDSNVGDIEKIGIALVALNKMAHQQIDDFIPLNYINRYRFQTPELMNQSQRFAKDVVEALTILGSFEDLESNYSNLFKDKSRGILKKNNFYDYIDSGEFEKVILIGLNEEKAKEIYSFFLDNYSELRKIYRGSLSPKIDSKIKKYFMDYKEYFTYLFKNTDEDENNNLIDNGNILIISDEEKKRIRRLFLKWVEHYNDERDSEKIIVLKQQDYLRIFRTIKAIREAIRKQPDIVDYLVDSAISQRNLYDLKHDFVSLLIQSLIEELDNPDNDSIGLLDGIIRLTKEEKIKMYSDSGVMLEIQEDLFNSNRDSLVIYSRNVREPYSIHLNKKVAVNDELKKRLIENQTIISSRLDNKNLTFSNNEFLFDFQNSLLDLSNSFKTSQIGRFTAILLNFINIDLSALLISYGISRDVLIEVLNNEISINENNLDNYINRDVLIEFRKSLSDKEISNKINNIINGIDKMIKNLEEKKSLSIPEDMELDEDFEYLRGYKFNNISFRNIPKIISMIGKTRIKYQDKYKHSLDAIVAGYNEILSDTNNPNYQETLRRLLFSLTTFYNVKLDDNTINRVCYFGNDDYSFRLSQNKAFVLLNSINKTIDMSLLEDDIYYREKVEDYIARICFKRADNPSNSDMEKYNDICEIRRDLKNNMFSYEKCKTKVFNIREEFKIELDNGLYDRAIKLLQKINKTVRERVELPVFDIKRNNEDGDGTKSGGFSKKKKR